jgi:putative MATE family efflux protein
MERNGYRQGEAPARRAALVDGPIGGMLARLTVPMIFGIVGMVMFNLVDVFFVGRLGTKELAALSFTFPVVLVIGSIAMGLGIGAGALISRTIGEGDAARVRRLTTDGLILALLFVAALVVVGLATIEPLFRALGATPEMLPFIKQYMGIWYPGVIFVVVPMVGNHAIRATGDTRTPALIMLVGATVNAVMDPLLIFGVGPFPRLGISGAAAATVIARATTLLVSLWVLGYRDRMLVCAPCSMRIIADSWKRILYIGLPAAASMIIVSLTAAVFTRFVSAYGAEAVAAFGVSTRIEFFSLTVVRALSTAIGPFIGQNWGAMKFERVRTGIRYSGIFSVGWGAAMFIVLAAAAGPIAAIFNDNPQVISKIVWYLRIVPVGYGMWGLLNISVMALNVLNKPLHATALMVIRMFALSIPLALLGGWLFGLTGIFSALAVANVIAGSAAFIVLNRKVRAGAERGGPAVA